MLARQIFIAAFISLFVCSFSYNAINAAEITAWRVKGKLIKEGDSKARVLTIAGKPDVKEVLQEAVDVGISKQKGNSNSTKIELWQYIRKNRDLIYKLYFIDGEISKIIWERI